MTWRTDEDGGHRTSRTLLNRCGLGHVLHGGQPFLCSAFINSVSEQSGIGTRAHLGMRPRSYAAFRPRPVTGQWHSMLSDM